MAQRIAIAFGLCVAALHPAAPQRVSRANPSSIVRLESGDSPTAIVEKAAHVIPSPQHLAWQRREVIGFVHFGINTFTDLEWGSGTESPALFNPTALDARQWMRAFKSAGVTEVVLVVKHHDGFALYPSRYTTHSVKASPWRDGKGDVMREVADAAREFGLKLGFYLSPADRHEAQPGRSFANGSAAVKTQIPALVPGDNRKPRTLLSYELDDYNRYFMNQMYELLTEYGPIAEVWLDGAPAAGHKQPYAFEAWYDIVHRLQPDAVIFNQNVRWVGNEDGYARETEWSVVPLPNDYDVEPSGDLTDADIGSRARLQALGVRFLAWYPAEADVSIRPGWFWHQSQNDSVKSLGKLVDIYYGSVGRNAVLMLNVPPDRRGLFTETDVRRLKEFGDHVAVTFRKNLASGARASASSTARGGTFAAANAVDASPDSYWKAANGEVAAALTVDLRSSTRFNRVMLGESMAVGQRVEAFAVDVWDGAAWKEVATATTIGYKRLLRIDDVRASRVRVRIRESRAAPSIATFGLFFERPVPAAGRGSR
jgi:alpha-L-fucosidase